MEESGKSLARKPRRDRSHLEGSNPTHNASFGGNTGSDLRPLVIGMPLRSEALLEDRIVRPITTGDIGLAPNIGRTKFKSPANEVLDMPTATPFDLSNSKGGKPTLRPRALPSHYPSRAERDTTIDFDAIPSNPSISNATANRRELRDASMKTPSISGTHRRRPSNPDGASKPTMSQAWESLNR